MPLGGAPLASVEGVNASATINLFLVVTPGTLPEKVAVVLGPEVVAERRRFFAAILKIRFDSLKRDDSEDEGAHNRHDNRKMGHSVLLCAECPRQLEEYGRAG
jgi:hypothetical protein